ncbi:MAG: flagellar biosynthesis regulator FlaF [Aurantimonas endophytica]|jgi:flagellar protein FlaF|uniref:Flagellar protein FlaF n=1 Tax=Aurantimonas endophytica TaxID=1522175 RepID=A0A7W6HCF2_9HYPH|nr:flagellar biosynthesis regulator FlaF [Aurantimonas endophytica]MBB4002487.1 flagellar protein FlaF [Aurantimonas endophytica]MCO6401892.1 flagellar biosynthesis regulator FlaF [Aurantimonas endophytica]
MYQFSYAEVTQDVEVDARDRERQALDHSITMLERASVSGPRSRDAIDAIYATRSLWAILVEDLAGEDNGLPEDLRAELISVGLWIMREAEAIRLGKSENFKGIIEISTLIRNGLN